MFPSWRERNSSEYIALRITLPIPRAPNLKHNERVKPIETAPIETTMWKKPVRFNPEVESRMKRAQKRRTLGRVEEEGGDEEKRERGGEDGQECREHVVS